MKRLVLPIAAFRFCRRCHPVAAHRSDTHLAPGGIASREVSRRRRACYHGRIVGGSRNNTTSGLSPNTPPACGYRLLQGTNATNQNAETHIYFVHAVVFI